MKTSRSSLWPVASAFAFLGLTGTLSAVQVTITGSDLPATNTVSTWTSTDGKLTLNAWADAAKTTPANLSRSLDGNFIGVFDGVNDNALDSGPDREEQLEIVLAADAGLAAFEVSYASTQANTTLSGFTENPGVIFNPNGGDGGIATYDEATGTVTFNFTTFSAPKRIIRFMNPAASAGQTLTMRRTFDASARQTPINSITYETSLNTAINVFGGSRFLPTGTVSSYTTPDNAVTMKGWTTQTQATPATFGVINHYFGITGNSNVNALNGNESATLEVAPTAGLHYLSFVHPSATGSVEILGFDRDPLATFDPNGVLNENGGVSYSAGTLTVTFGVFNQQQRLIRFGAPAATAGRTLRIQRTGGTGQVSFNQIGYLDSLPPSLPVIVAGLDPESEPIADVSTTLSVTLDSFTYPVPSYVWELDDGAGFFTVGTDPTYTFVAGAGTDGTYRVTVTNSEGSATSSTVVTSQNDDDGINNQWEIDFFGDHLLYDDVDVEPDGLTNSQEYAIGTKPNIADTDGDSLFDGDETNTGIFISATDTGTNPLSNGDSDLDGWADAYEVLNGPTDPFNAATPGGPNPEGFAVAFDAAVGYVNATDVPFGPLVHAGAPGVEQKNWNRTVDVPNPLSVTSGSTADIASPSTGEIVDSSGAVIGDGTTGVTLQYTAGAGAFAFISSTDKPYGRLFNSFIYGTGANPDSSITLGNIPYATYDAYVYVGADTNARRGLVTSTSAGIAYSFTTAAGTGAAGVNPGANYLESTDTATGYPAANYVVFRNQTSATFDVTTSRGPAPTGNLGIFGVQIVKSTSTPVPTYANWATTHAGGQAPGLDFDLDGVSNGVEYFMGETGSTFTANPALAGGTITWPRDPAANATFEVQASTAMAAEGSPGGWTTVTTGVVEDENSVSYTPPAGADKQFIRLKVIIP